MSDSSNQPELTRQTLYSIAIYQKIILFCILAYLIAVVAQFVLPQEFRLVLGVVFLGVGVAAAVFVFMLALKIYPVGVGVLLGILTLVPLVGLITLFIINQKATGVLQKHGYRVGFMGVSLEEFKRSDGSGPD